MRRCGALQEKRQDTTALGWVRGGVGRCREEWHDTAVLGWVLGREGATRCGLQGKVCVRAHM